MPVLGRVYVEYCANRLKQKYGSKVDEWIEEVRLERKVWGPTKDIYDPNPPADDIMICPYRDADTGSEYYVVFFIALDMGRSGENGYFYTPTGKMPDKVPMTPRIFHKTNFGDGWYYFQAR
jgi:hypothetical protein